MHENNPGGATKFYHLYDGSIPFESIVEAKTIYYKNSTSPCNCHVLEIVEVGNPVLRKHARELSIEEIQSPEIQTLIQEMKNTLRAAPGVGLAAPQIGKSLQLAVIEDVSFSHLTPEQVVERERHIVPFHVIINPILYIEEKETAQFFEGCISIPTLLGIVPRAKSVRIECLNEKAEPIVIHAKGWYARILQHEIDHLNGILCIDRTILPTLMTEENYVRLWKNKTIKEILSTLTTNTKNDTTKK